MSDFPEFSEEYREDPFLYFKKMTDKTRDREVMGGPVPTAVKRMVEWLVDEVERVRKDRDEWKAASDLWRRDYQTMREKYLNEGGKVERLHTDNAKLRKIVDVADRVTNCTADVGELAAVIAESSYTKSNL